MGKNVVEQFLNSPEGRLPSSRTSRNKTLSYNEKEVKAKLKEKKNATKGKRTKKVVAKQSNTLTQMMSKRNKNKKVKVNNVAKIDNNVRIMTDKEFNYEIFPFKGLPHHEMHNNTDNNAEEPLPEKILNLRKVKGWKLEVLVQYVNTVREWSCIHGVIHDLKDETTAFMKTYGLTFSICGYAVDPSKFSKAKLEKIISTDDYGPPLEYNFKPTATTPRDDVDYVELSKLIHRKLQKFATFLERPTDGQLIINVTPTTVTEYKDDNEDENEDEWKKMKRKAFYKIFL